LKVDISVVAPEKSIVPWAWATPEHESVRKAGHSACAARRRFRLKRGCAHRWAHKVDFGESGKRNLRDIGTSVGLLAWNMPSSLSQNDAASNTSYLSGDKWKLSASVI
jgi:hypothetical protein